MLIQVVYAGDTVYDLGNVHVLARWMFHRNVGRCIEIWHVAWKYGTLHRRIARFIVLHVA